MKCYNINNRRSDSLIKERMLKEASRKNNGTKKFVEYIKASTPFKIREITIIEFS